jgi:hypothetical protein
VEQKTAQISVPVAVTVFPGEIYRAPRSWTERAYAKLFYFNEVDNGGHFAAWEQPQVFLRRCARRSDHCVNKRVAESGHNGCPLSQPGATLNESHQDLPDQGRSRLS